MSNCCGNSLYHNLIFLSCFDDLRQNSEARFHTNYFLTSIYLNVIILPMYQNNIIKGGE